MKKLFLVLIIIPFIALAGCSSNGAGDGDDPKSPDDPLPSLVITDMPAQYNGLLFEGEISLKDESDSVCKFSGRVVNSTLTCATLTDADGKNWTGESASEYVIEHMTCTENGNMIMLYAFTPIGPFNGGTGTKTASAKDALWAVK